MKNNISAGAAVALACRACTAQAAQLTPPTLSARTALGYPSAFSDYKPWQDIKPADWRAVNDTVRDAPQGRRRHTARAGHARLRSSGSTAPGQRPAPAHAESGGHQGARRQP